LIFEKLNEKYVEDAVKLAQDDYNREQQKIEALYDKDYKDVFTKSLNNMFKSN